MIHYSSINDAWGNKEIYKNNKETFSQNTKPDIIKPVEIIKVLPVKNEHFTNMQDCNVVEHIKNCPECKKKLSEMFTNTDNSKEINLFGFKINLTKDVLKIILIILLILITVNLFSLINTVFENKPMYLYPPQVAMNNMNSMMKYIY